MTDVIHVPQAGKIVGGKLQLGSIAMVKGKAKLKLTKTVIPLGDGVELVSEMSASGIVWLGVTAEAAKRHGWAHPGNAPKQPTAHDVDRLRAIVGSSGYGQQEQIDAIAKIATVDPALAQQLTLANQWLFNG